MAQIHQYIYTRLRKEESPRNKHGFQSAFIPEAHSDRSFILELESRIHFPEYDTFSEKNVVFYRKIGDKTFLVILWMRLLPDARDEQGRGGIFMVQGFIVPPEVHHKVKRPLTLMKLLEKHLFFDREDVMNSPLADREKGFIKPVELSATELEGLEEPGGDLEVWEKQLMSFIFKQVRGELEDWTLALKGEPGPVEETFNRLAGFLPTEVREQIGWDPAFDGGKIFFSPFKMFGYSKAEPVTGRPLIFDLETKTYLDSTLLHQLLTQGNPFDRFIDQVLSPETPQAETDGTYQLAMALASGEGVPQGMSLGGDFAEAIQPLARGYLESEAASKVNRAWAFDLKDALEYNLVCDLLNARLTESLLAVGFEQAIVRKGLTPARIPEALPEALIQKGPPRLHLLNAMWTEEEPERDLVKAIAPPELLEACRLMATTRLVKQDWFFELLARFPGVFDRMLEENPFSETGRKWLQKQVPRSHRKLSELLVNFMIRSKRLGFMASQDRDWNALVEEFLREGTYEDKELKLMVRAAEKAGLDPVKSPVLNAYAFPEGEIPEVVRRNDDLRSRFAHALVVVHDASRREMAKMGFSEGEIRRAIGSRKGLIAKLKTLLGH